MMNRPLQAHTCTGELRLPDASFAPRAFTTYTVFDSSLIAVRFFPTVFPENDRLAVLHGGLLY